MGLGKSGFLNLPATVSSNPGGIQIGGHSSRVRISDNQIFASGRNAITLGSLTVLDADGNDTGQLTGVITMDPDPCATSLSLELNTPTSLGSQERCVVDGNLAAIEITRNRIETAGLCGIGPIGFFNLTSSPEIVNIDGLIIDSNQISNTLQVQVSEPEQGNLTLGYGAICLPLVQDLTISDNKIIDFGFEAGSYVCGIFIQAAESISISRNQVLETRDWKVPVDIKSAKGVRGGICIEAVMPPTLSSTTHQPSSDQSILFQPGLPALRIEHNTVRVPLGVTLQVFGFGPFSIVNNHLACGGKAVSTDEAVAQSVLIYNLGPSIDSGYGAKTYTEILNTTRTTSVAVSNSSARRPAGTVTFVDNVCQMEARRRQSPVKSNVQIHTLDSLVFCNNQAWLDAFADTAQMNVYLVADTLQVIANRFQESADQPVRIASAVTAGHSNVTAHNVSTYCIYAVGDAGAVIGTPNLRLKNASECALEKELQDLWDRNSPNQA